MNRLASIVKIRQRLQNGGYSVGSWMQIPNSSVAEMLGRAGYDWVAIDMEHGSIAVNQLPNLFRALELGNTLPLVRLAVGSPKDCKQALDAGAGGVIVPMIQSADHLIAMRDACCWPPSGTRGVGFSRANLFGKYFDQYREEAQAPLLVAMIENITALDELDSILSVRGLDAILIGPYDLSASMGLTAQFNHPDFCSALNKIFAITNKKAIPAGIHIVSPSPDELKLKLSEGYRFIAYSIDAVFFNNAIVSPVL
jgi:2-dehydro-3-deoxyglucarate aldolase